MNDRPPPDARGNPSQLAHEAEVNVTTPTDLTACPFCNANLVESEIPEQHRHLFGGAAHGSRVVTIYDRHVEARIHHECPNCGATLEDPTVAIAGDRIREHLESDE